MIVKDIIVQAAQLVGRADAAEAISADSQDSEINRFVKTMLFCFYAVVDELARSYFPLRTSQLIFSITRKFKFSDFVKTPSKIISVTHDGKEVEWQVYAGYLQASQKEIVVEYEYLPEKADISTDFVFPEVNVGERLISFGMAAEYMLIQGEIGSAECWEKRYREEIDKVMACQPVKCRIPPRRWV